MKDTYSKTSIFFHLCKMVGDRGETGVPLARNFPKIFKTVPK